MPDQVLIGFDAREAGGDDPRWDAERRERFLLRRDVVRPLSVDRQAWPTVFEMGMGRSLSDAERHRLGFGTIPVPGWVGANAPLWEDLSRMRSHLEEQRADPAGTVVVAVGWLSRLEFPAPERPGGYPMGPYAVPTEPPRPESTWSLLGYDVADGSWVSGLSNCGYTPEEGGRLGDEWASKLNDHHLFDDQETAFAFLDVTNARVPEHAPFHVYSLYALD
jgi:hypothetical protein